MAHHTVPLSLEHTTPYRWVGCTRTCGAEHSMLPMLLILCVDVLYSRDTLGVRDATLLHWWGTQAPVPVDEPLHLALPLPWVGALVCHTLSVHHPVGEQQSSITVSGMLMCSRASRCIQGLSGHKGPSGAPEGPQRGLHRPYPLLLLLWAFGPLT